MIFSLPKKHRQKGFTLLELLVALAIFAVVSAMAYGGLNAVLRAKSGNDEHNLRMRQLQKAFSIIERDVEQAVLRSVRDNYGETKGAMISADYGEYRFLLTRHGWNNPFASGKRVRSYLQRVAYQLEDQQLKRIYWFDLDRDYDSRKYDMILLDNVKSLDLRFVDGQGKWQTRWPSLGAEEEVLPRGVELTVELQGWGKITRLFALAPGQVIKAQPVKGTQRNTGAQP